MTPESCICGSRRLGISDGRMFFACQTVCRQMGTRWRVRRTLKCLGLAMIARLNGGKK